MIISVARSRSMQCLKTSLGGIERNYDNAEKYSRRRLRLFSDKGYHNVSMHEIAKEAEFGIGTLYKFFTNKEDLYKALIMGMAEKYHHTLMQVLEQERNPLQAIKRYIAVRQKLFFDNLPSCACILPKPEERALT